MLKLRTTEAVTAAFHLHNRKARRELKAAVEERTLSFPVETTYVSVELGRVLTYHQCLESQRKELTKPVGDWHCQARLPVLRRWSQLP